MGNPARRPVEDDSDTPGGTARPRLWVVREGHTSEIEVDPDQPPAEPDASADVPGSAVSGEAVESVERDPEPAAGSAVQDAPAVAGGGAGSAATVHEPRVEPTEEAAPAAAAKPAPAPAAADSPDGGMPRWATRGLLALLAAATVAAAVFGTMQVRFDAAGTAASVSEVAGEVNDALGISSIAGAEAMVESLADARGTLGDIDGSLPSEGGEPVEAIAAATSALATLTEEAEAAAQVPRSEVTSDSFASLEAAHVDAVDALESMQRTLEISGSPPTLSIEPLVAAQQEAREGFVKERRERQQERRAIQRDNAERATVRDRLDQLERDVTAAVGEYESSRSRTGQWSRSIQGRPWFQVGYGDLAELESAIASRRAIRDRLAGYAASAPSGVAAEITTLTSVLDDGIRGMQAAYDGFWSTINPYTDYRYITETPAWGEFGRASSTVDARLPAAKDAFAAAITSTRADNQPRRVPPPITE